MKIVYVVPGPMEKGEVKRRGQLLKKWAFPETEVDIMAAEEGPASIESMYEEYLSIPGAAKLIYDAERKGYDAAILGCAGDPGLDAMREITTKMLVVGPGQASMLVGAMLGHRFSIVTIEDSMVASSYEQAYKAGVLEKLASVVSVNIPVLELLVNRDESLRKIIELGKKAVGVPVVNPSKVGLKVAEALVGSGLMHSKIAFATPVKISSGKVANLDDLYLKNSGV